MSKARGIKCPHCDGTGILTPQAATPGDMILSVRKRKGWTQEQLSQAVRLSRAQIANIEASRSDMPLKTLARFAEAFGCSMKDLVP